jgi:multidrug efflux system membrane fusion protein
MDEFYDRPKIETQPAPMTRAPAAVRKPRLRRAIVFLVLLLLAAGAAWWWFARPAPQPAGRTPPGRTAEAPPQPVGAETIASGDIRIILNELGTVTPLANVTVKTQINGQLVDVGFQEGQMVKKGDFLAQIDPRPYQVALEQAEATLAKDQAVLYQAQADLTRYQLLAKQNSIALQQAENQRFVVAQDQAATQVDQAQIDSAKLNLTYAHITAPVGGRVGLRQVDPGNYVQTSDANGLVVLTQIEPISVIFTVTEDNLPAVMKRLRAGAKLPVESYDRSNTALLATGELSSVDNQVNTTTGTVNMRATFANAEDALYPNQFVNARLLVDTLQDVVRVPVAAVQQGAPGSYVYVINADNTVTARPVKLGPTDGGYEQVLSGLSAGERVVIDGTDRLRDGQKVMIPPPAPAAPAGAATRERTPAAGAAGQRRNQP